MPADAGRVYGPYRVVRPLGAGGMGTVLLAEDLRLSRFVALKTFSGQTAASGSAHDRMLSEARAAARLSHPAIATVYDVFEDGGQMVIVFEFVEGETLAARLARGRLPIADAVRIGEQLADGLAAAHAQGVIHRDLKPGNVMLTPEGRVKILDFGIARNLPLEDEETSASLVTTGLYAGTPAYAAPEQWLGETINPQTDLYALGVVLFEMLGGRRPFDAPSRFALMQQIIEAPRPRLRTLNEHVPPSVEALVDSALSRDPAQRPASARDMANILRAIERDVSVVPAAPHAPERPRLRRRLIAATVVLVAITAGLIGILWRPLFLPTETTMPVVAVLPLVNATGATGNDYLAAGIADSLTTSLASLDGITVLSRAAVASVGAVKEPSRIAKDLGASYLVEGSVQQSADRVRISVNLVRSDRSVAWGDSVEGTFDRVFELQSRLAAALGRALSVQVSAADRAKLAKQPTSNVDALAAYWRGRALLDRRDVKGNTDAALAAFDQAVRLDPNFAIAHAARVEALWFRYLATRDIAAAQEAIAAGTTALRLDPDQPNVRYSLAVTLAGTGRPDEAIDELQRALALRPNYDDARRELGNVLANKGRVDEAVAEFRRAIALRPTFWGHYSALGLALLRAAHYEDAAEAFTHVTELHPDNADGYQQLGTAYHYLGRSDDALRNYQRSIEIQPTAGSYSNLGALLHERGEYAKAVEAYLAALRLRSTSASTHRNLGDAYARLGRREDALGAYRAAARLAQADLELNPRNPLTRAALAVYLAKGGDIASAGRRLAEARALAPDDPDVLYRAAVVSALSGKPREAFDALARAVQLGYSRDRARTDDDLATLRHLPEFRALTQGGLR